MEGLEIILKIAGVGIFVALLNGILKKSDKEELTTYTTIAGILVAFMLILDMVGGMIDVIKNIFRL